MIDYVSLPIVTANFDEGGVFFLFWLYKSWANAQACDYNKTAVVLERHVKYALRLLLCLSHAAKQGMPMRGWKSAKLFYIYIFFFGINLGQNPYVPLWPILKNFWGHLGPIIGSKMCQNILKCHLWGPDGPKWLEQGGTRLEQGTGYKDWPFWSLYHSINTQIWPLGGLKMGQNGSIWLLLGLNGLWCPKMVGTSWNKVGTG